MTIYSHKDAELVGEHVADLAIKNPIYFSLGCVLTFIFTYYIFRPLL